MLLFDLIARVARTVLSFAFAYARPALALVLLVAPIVCTLLTLDANSNPVAACCLLAVWGLVMALHALPRDATRTIEDQPDGVCESLVLGLAGIQTLQILHDTPGAHNIPLWVLVTTAAVGIVALKHIDEEWVNPRSKYARLGGDDVVSSRPMGSRVPQAMLVVTLVAGVLRALVFAPSGSGTTTAILILAETTVCLMLMLRLYLSEATPNGLEESMLSMLYLHACTFPLMDLVSVGGILHLSVLGLTLLMTFVATAQIDPRAKLQTMPWAVVEGVVDLGVRLVGSTSVWQVVVLISFGAIIRSLNSAWFTAHADFPDALQAVARGALDLIEAGPKLFMELTNRPEVQQFMVQVVPEISAPRGLIYRILAPIIVSFEQGRDGIDYTLLPLDEFFCMLAFCMGPLVAAIGVLVQIFANGAAFAKSRWFWAFSAFGCMLFAMLTLVVSGPKVTAVALIFVGAPSYRAYTETGQYALLALLVLCAACIVLFVILSQTESDALRLLRLGTGAKVRPRRRPRREVPSPWTVMKRGANRLSGLATSPAFILAAVGVAIIVFTTLLRGSPIRSIEVNKIETLPDHYARWLKITELDRVAAIQSTFVGFLVQVFGSDIRLAFLLRFLINLVMEQVQCLPCLCIPGLSEVGGVFTTVGGALSSGFHLLEHKSRRELYDDSSYFLNGTYASSPLRRRTLFSFDPTQSCTRPSDSCNGAAICVSDVLDPIVDILDFLTGLLTQGLHEGVRLLVEQVMNAIPGFGRIDNVFGSITLLNQYENFDPLDMATFSGIPGRFLGSVLGILGNQRFPAFASLQLSTTWIVLVCFIIVGVLVLLFQLGLFEPMVQSAFTTLGVTVALGFLAGLVALVFMGYAGTNELRVYGRELKVTTEPVPLAWDAIGLGLVIVSCFLVVGAASAIELTKTKATYDERRKQQGTAGTARKRLGVVTIQETH